MRTFAHFPEDSRCLICGTNRDEECVLIPIDGTEDGNNIQAICVHLKCITNASYRYNRTMNVIYTSTRPYDNES